ncbi:MAG TPA: acetate--CoA ligase family protein, partial [bacterium]|nr:acetate--CoA ligase family protein [bacterium]
MKFLRNHNVPVTSDPYEAVSCLGAMYAYYRSLSDGRGTPEPVAIDRAGINRLAEAARADGRSFLLADEAQRLMELAGITTAGSRVATSAAAAVKAAGEIGYPVVLKVVSRDILHKSEAGGVLLDLGTAAAVRAGYRRIMDSCRAYNPEARIKGVEVCEQVKPGTELILGARRDASFGPIVMCGMGGIYVEVLKDVTFRSFPLTRKEADRMLKDLRVYPILSGVRGQKSRDTATVVEALLKLGSVVKECPLISDIEINPVVVYQKGLKAVDVRVLLSK